MVDWVHFTTTHDTFHQVVSPKIWETVSKLSGIYAGDDSKIDLGTELRQLLMEHSWNGRSFSRELSAVNLLSALKNFKVKSERTLGKGAYAKVLLARSMLTGEVVVHKHVQIDSPEHGLPLHVLRELAILQKMRHPHIVRSVPAASPAFLYVLRHLMVVWSSSCLLCLSSSVLCDPPHHDDRRQQQHS
jgi:hypothetical protein